MSPEEQDLFDKATPAARDLFKQAKAMQREQRRAEYKAMLLKQSQNQPVPAADNQQFGQ